MFDCLGFGASFLSPSFAPFSPSVGASRLSMDVHAFTELSCEKGNSASCSSMLCEKLSSRLTVAKRLERRFFRTFSLGFMVSMSTALPETTQTASVSQAKFGRVSEKMKRVLQRQRYSTRSPFKQDIVL